MIAAAPLGKTKTVTQVVAVTLLILQRPYPLLGLPADARGRVRGPVHDLERPRLPLAVAPCARPAARRTRRVAGRPAARELGGMLTETGLTARAGGVVHGRAARRRSSRTCRAAPPISSAAWSPIRTRPRRSCSASPASCSPSTGRSAPRSPRRWPNGARARFGTTLAAGVTGIAGPNADGTDKPVGLTYIAWPRPHATSSREFTFHGDRWANRRAGGGGGAEDAGRGGPFGSGRPELGKDCLTSEHLFVPCADGRVPVKKRLRSAPRHRTLAATT